MGDALVGFGGDELLVSNRQAEALGSWGRPLGEAVTQGFVRTIGDVLTGSAVRETRHKYTAQTMPQETLNLFR